MRYRILKFIFLLYLNVSVENIKIVKTTKQSKLNEEDANKLFSFFITSSFLFLVSSVQNKSLEQREFEYLYTKYDQSSNNAFKSQGWSK